MHKLKVALLFVILPFLGGCNEEIFGDSSSSNERKIRNLFNNEWEVVREGDFSFGDDPYNKFSYPISKETEESFFKIRTFAVNNVISKTIIGINKNGGLYIFPRFYDEDNLKDNTSNFDIYYGCTTQTRNVFSCVLKILNTPVGDIDFFARKLNEDTIGLLEIRYVNDDFGKRNYVFSARLYELKKVGPWDEKTSFKTISERNKYHKSLIELYGGSNYESIVSEGKCK